MGTQGLIIHIFSTVVYIGKFPSLKTEARAFILQNNSLPRKFSIHLCRKPPFLNMEPLGHSMDGSRSLSLSLLLLPPFSSIILFCFLMTRDYPQARHNPLTVLVWFSWYVSIFWIRCLIMALSEANESEPTQNTPLWVREFITSDAKTSGGGGSGVVSSAAWWGNRGHLLSIMGPSPQSVGHVSFLASRATASSRDVCPVVKKSVSSCVSLLFSWETFAQVLSSRMELCVVLTSGTENKTSRDDSDSWFVL